MEKSEDVQNGLTDEEREDVTKIINEVLAKVCVMADKHNIDRDSMLNYFANMLVAFAEVSTIQNYDCSGTDGGGADER